MKGVEHRGAANGEYLLDAKLAEAAGFRQFLARKTEYLFAEWLGSTI